MILWGVAISAGHVVLGLVGRVVLDVPGSLLFFGLCAALTLAVALVGARLVRPRRPPDDPGGSARRRAGAAAVVARVRARLPRLRFAPAHAGLTSRRSAS